MQDRTSPSELTSSIGAKLIKVNAGSFQMGSPEEEEGHRVSEPLRKVTLTHDYYLGQTPITQEQYETVIGENPSDCTEAGKDAPVECINRCLAIDFHMMLTDLDREAGVLPPDWEYRLPMEAEWEFACRAGNQAAWYGESQAIAWFYDNSGDGPHPVRQKRPNDWGFYDMLGNVWELCEDVIHTGNGWHAVRGGSFFNSASSCRAASRMWYGGGRYVGFRLFAGPVGVACSPAEASFPVDDVKPKQTSRGIYDAMDADDVELAKRFLTEDKTQVESVDLIPPPIHYAIYDDKPRFVEVLLDHGADIERRDPDFASRPLTYAVVHQRHEIIRLLIERGANTEGALSTALRGLAGEFDVYEDLQPAATYQATIDLIRELGVE